VDPYQEDDLTVAKKQVVEVVEVEEVVEEVEEEDVVKMAVEETKIVFGLKLMHLILVVKARITGLFLDVVGYFNEEE
jgi:translation elongation factor EF-1beta